MKKFFLFSMAITLVCTSCNSDEEFEPLNSSDAEKGQMYESKSYQTKTRATFSDSDWQTIVYSGTPTQQTSDNQKVVISGAAIPGGTGVYICQVVKLVGTVTVQDPDNEVIRGVTNDNRCGYIPNTIGTSPVRGTQVLPNPSNPNEYTITTNCYKVICNVGGVLYPSNYWLPCSPSNATLVYQYRSF